MIDEWQVTEERVARGRISEEATDFKAAIILAAKLNWSINTFDFTS